MLGGSFLVALMRNGMSITLMLSFFLMLDRPRFTMKKTICYYVIFGFLFLGFFILCIFSLIQALSRWRPSPFSLSSEFSVAL